MYNYTCQLTLIGEITEVTADWSNVTTDTTANISCLIEPDDVPQEVTGGVRVIWGDGYRLRQDNQLNCEYINTFHSCQHRSRKPRDTAY